MTSLWNKHVVHRIMIEVVMITMIIITISTSTVTCNQHHHGKELLYCVSITWPDETADTVATGYSRTGGGYFNDSFQDDHSIQGFGGVSGPSMTPNIIDHRPTSPGSVKNSLLVKSPRSSRKRLILRRGHSDGARHGGGEDSSIDSAGLSSLPGTTTGRRKSRGASFFRRKHKRGISDLSRNSSLDDGSISSLLDPPKAPFGLASSAPPGRKDQSPTRSNIAAMDMSMPNIKLGEYPNRNKNRSKKYVAGIPIGGMESNGDENNNSILNLQPRPLIEEVSESHEHYDEYVEHMIAQDKLFNESQTERIGNLRQTLSDEYGLEKKSSHEEQNLIEQEKLHHQFLNKQRKKRSDTTKRIVGGTKIAVAASAAVGVGILTAGVGLAAGLVFLGGAAAIGGTAGVAEVGLKRTLKRKDSLTIATTNYELAKLWKATLDACLEQESLQQSTWGQLFVADGRKATSALINNVLSGDEDDLHQSLPATPRGSNVDFSKSRSNMFLRDPKFFAQASARWRPLEGGWVSLAQGLRIFKEERIQIDEKAQKVTPLAVGGSTCTPLRTHIVLNAHPTEAFMCIMSYARFSFNGHLETLTPNSGQTASYRLIEKIDDHTDVLHLVCRKLYLFPSWTEARDFVLLRYWRYEPDGSYIICYESMDHPSCPPQSGFVRGEMHQVFTLAPPKTNDYRHKGSSSTECMLSSVVQVDPKGWVPTKPMGFLSNQTYADAFGVSALLQTLDIRDALENDRFLDLSPDLNYHIPATGKHSSSTSAAEEDYDLRFVNRERCDSFTSERFPDIGSHPEPLGNEKWAEPDANSFKVRGPAYKQDRVKVNAGTSIGQLIAVDVVLVDKPIYSGMSTHPNERIQLALERERIMKENGKKSDAPPFIFVVNIILPGPPFYHGVFYYAVDDMSTIDGSNGTPSSKLCQRFLFGKSDEFRDRTFKLIPRIVEGNFLVRKAVGNTPAIMGTKLKQYYVRNERFMEVILDCGSSPVATGVIRLSLGYAKTLVVDMCFLLEADDEEYLPEKVFGAVRMKYPSFGTDLRKVEDPAKLL